MIAIVPIIVTVVVAVVVVAVVVVAVVVVAVAVAVAVVVVVVVVAVVVLIWQVWNKDCWDLKLVRLDPHLFVLVLIEALVPRTSTSKKYTHKCTYLYPV